MVCCCDTILKSNAAAEPEMLNGAIILPVGALTAIFLVNSIPFIGFGFLDNMIMIIAGEYIDMTLGKLFQIKLKHLFAGITLGISTMAAAALGNLISDIFGVGLAHYVEVFVAKFFGK